jgi:hypothetical protein
LPYFGLIIFFVASYSTTIVVPCVALFNTCNSAELLISAVAFSPLGGGGFSGRKGKGAVVICQFENQAFFEWGKLER